MHNHRQFIQSLLLIIAKEKWKIPLSGTMGAPVIRGEIVTRNVEEYESHSSHTGPDPVAKDIIVTYPYYWSDTLQEMIKMING